MDMIEYFNRELNKFAGQVIDDETEELIKSELRKMLNDMYEPRKLHVINGRYDEINNMMHVTISYEKLDKE